MKDNIHRHHDVSHDCSTLLHYSRNKIVPIADNNNDGQNISSTTVFLSDLFRPLSLYTHILNTKVLRTGASNRTKPSVEWDGGTFLPRKRRPGRVVWTALLYSSRTTTTRLLFHVPLWIKKLYINPSGACAVFHRME
jgi:hypothetical protein